MSFTAPVDVANAAIQHFGAPRITALTDSVKAAAEANFRIDKVRRAELRRNVWRFSTRRVALRSITSTTKLLTFGTWSSGATYAAGDIVKSGTDTFYYLSLQASNTNHDPSVATNNTWWQQYFGPVTADTYAAGATYSIGENIVSSGTYYTSLVNANKGNTPPSAGNWLSLTTQPSAITLYVTSPVVQTLNGTSRVLFMLPYGFMRMAAQDPKAAGSPYQGTTGGMQWLDFELEDGYLVSSALDADGNAAGASAGKPLIFRFAADITDVTRMDDMFCELWAARLAAELCETMTQGQGKHQQIMAQYQLKAAEARRVNEIEVGSTEPDEMTYRSSRMPDVLQQLPQAQKNG